MNRSLLFKKVYGSLAGAAVGDAMGGTTEGLHYEAIKRKFGRITDERFIGIGRDLKPRQLATTDDTNHLRILAKAIIRKGGRIIAYDFAEGILEDMHLGVMAPTEVELYKKIDFGIKPHEAGIGQLKTPTPTFQSPPIGIVNACDPYCAAKDAYELFSVWVDGFAQEAPMAVVSAVAEAFKPTATIDSIVDASMKYCGPEVRTHIQKAVKIAQEYDDVFEAIPELHKELSIPFLPRYRRQMVKLGLWKVPAEEFSPGGYPLEMPAIAIAFFIIAKGDPMTAIIGATNFGRDCDGTAGIAGAIAGAWKGIDAISMSTVRKVNEMDKAFYGQEWDAIDVFAEKMMNPVLNTMKEKEEISRNLQKLTSTSV